MKRLLFRTAGESHGMGLLAFIEGLPFGTPIDVPFIDAALRRRQGGKGRSRRQQIETDSVRVFAGCKRGRTLGGPVALWVGNKDVRIDEYRRITRPRPGHADLAGAIRFLTTDVADVMERASARETAARVAAGALAQSVLDEVGIRTFAWVRGIGGIDLAGSPNDAVGAAERDRSPFYSLDPAGDAAAEQAVEAAQAAGDTLGGMFEVRVEGVPAGLGSHTQWDARMDGRLAQALMSIQGIKGVEIGSGMQASVEKGLAFHDPIMPEGGGSFLRPTNHAGGIEGGLTNGAPIVLRAAMKPIPTVGRALASVDLATGEAAAAAYERSDVCAVPAASVVGEAMVSLVVLDAVLESIPAPTFGELVAGVAAFRERVRRLA